MAAPIPFLLPFALSDIGAPLVAGRLYTYEIGTSNPKITYVDSEGTIVNTNPVILNSAGRFRCYLGVGGYKFVLRDAQGNMLWQENYNNVGGGAGGGSFQVTSTIADLRAAGAGSTQFVQVMGYYVAGDIGPRTYRFDPSSSAPDDGGGVIAPNSGAGRWILEWDGSPISIRVFGAKGDGVFNDSVPLLAAQAWAAGMNLKSGIVFSHVPVFYNLGNDAIVVSVFAAVLPGGIIRQPTNGIKFAGGFHAGAYRIFYNTETSLADTFAGTRLLTPACAEWFGAVGDGTADDVYAIQALFLTAPNFVAFPSGAGYASTAAPFEASPAPLIILCSGAVKNPNTDEIYIAVGVTLSGALISDSAEIATAVIENLTATNADVGTLNVTASLTALVASITNSLTVGGEATAGSTGQGYFRGRAGTSTTFVRPQGPLWVQVTDAANVNAAITTLVTKPFGAGIFPSNGGRFTVKGFLIFANNANTKTFSIALAEGFNTIVFNGPSATYQNRVLFFELSVLKKGDSSVCYTIKTLVYDQGGPLWGAYPGAAAFNSSDVVLNWTGPDVIAPNPHHHTVTVPAAQITSLSNATGGNTAFSLNSDFTLSITATGVSSGDINLREAEAIYTPAPDSVT